MSKHSTVKDIDFWVHKYNQECQGNKCTRVKACVMDLWDKPIPKNTQGNLKKLQYNPVRMGILEEMAKITLEVNDRLSKFIQEARKNTGKEVPEQYPVFSVDIYFCPSCKRPEIDWGY